VLNDLDTRLSTALGSVKKGVEALNAQRNGAPPAAPAPLADAAAKSKRLAFDAQQQTLRETAELESVRVP
jgi:hypothetical protein